MGRMNRQARLVGTRSWRDHGAVTFEKASQQEAKIIGDQLPGRDEFEIETRDAEHPNAVFRSQVTRRVTYDVKQFRADGDD